MRKAKLSPHKWGVFETRYKAISFFRSRSEEVCVRRCKTERAANEVRRSGQTVRRLTDAERRTS